ncbi:MAG TPA: ABC transporter ATP-binding protein [Nocardioidaceae bacterium]|nr:ABC transporter ATP-binding protein [Nocardioidaceae bacterium]
MSTPLLEAQDLHVHFPTGRRKPPARAVDGVDLAVAPGEIVALVGESGCGKTTLVRTLLGLERPHAGTVRFSGKPLEYGSGALRSYRRRVQLVLQDPTGALNPRQTVYESVAEGLRIHKVVAEKKAQGIETTEADLVAEALSKAGMRPPERFFMSYPHELSGGQRQRVVIAGALALEPDLLIADEPVSALDASIRGEILALLLKLRDEHGLTVLVVTHDLGLAWNIADRVAVMYLGRLVEVGRTEEVLETPEHPYTQALLSVVPEAAQVEQVVLSGEAPDPTDVPAGCRFHPRCQALESGAAEHARVADLCTTRSLPVLDPEGGHRAACWIALGRPTDAGAVQATGASEVTRPA